MWMYDFTQTSLPFVSLSFCTNQSIICVCTILQKPVHHVHLYDITKTSPPFVSLWFYKNQSTICVCSILHKPVHYSKHHQSSVLLVHWHSWKHVFPWWWLPVCRRDAALVTVVLPHPGRTNPRETNALRVWPKQTGIFKDYRKIRSIMFFIIKPLLYSLIDSE